MLINVKMLTIVGILCILSYLTFMSWIGFMLRWVEYEKSFITSGPIESRMDVHERIQRVIGGPGLLENHKVED